MKKITSFAGASLQIAIIAALAVLLISGCESTSSPKQAEPDRIVIYTSMYQDVIDAINIRLSRSFPNYQIEFVQGGTGIIQQMIASQQRSGKLGCDILMVAEPAYSFELKDAGMLHSYKSREASNLAFDYDPDGYWYPVRISNMVLAFNPDRNPRHTVPDSFYDFAHDTRLRGAVSTRNPFVSGTTFAAATALRDKYGNSFLEALGRQRVLIDYGSEQTITRLENGECIVSMVLEESIIKARHERNSRLEVIYPTDGTVVIPSNIMIVNDKWSANKNTKAAEEIAEWFLSTEGQLSIVNGWMHSVRKDFARLVPFGPHPIEQIFANSIPVDWETVYHQRDEIRARIEEYLVGGR